MNAIFDPSEHPLALTLPDHLSDIDSWHGLIPVAFALMSLHRPRTLVELGTHKGDSYAAFCQAAEALGRDCRCYAVDTWQGDEHAGYYGEDVLAGVRRWHDTRYGAFSRLVRSTFDEAAPHFADGDIDLLHIDGLHTYEAVRHDFETWRPKLSARGIVLFHDVNVRERGFGVWQLWEELAARHPARVFPFSHGLGVLAVGDISESPLQSWFDADDAQWQATVDLLFALGERVRLTGSERRLTERVSALSGAPAERDAALRRLSQLGEKHTHAQAVVAERDRQLKQTNARAAELERALGATRQALEAHQAALVKVRNSFAYRLARVLGLAGRGGRDA